MTAATTPTYTLTVGEQYRYNFAGSPAGVGVYLGTVDPIGWIAIAKGLSGEGEVTFLNPALLCALTPESYPQ